MLFVFFVVRWIFVIERNYLWTPVRKICASFANYELLQYEVHEVRKKILTTTRTRVITGKIRIRNINRKERKKP